MTLRVSPSIVVLEPESDFKGNLVIARVIGAKPVARVRADGSSVPRLRPAPFTELS